MPFKVSLINNPTLGSNCSNSIPRYTYICMYVCKWQLKYVTYTHIHKCVCMYVCTYVLWSILYPCVHTYVRTHKCVYHTCIPYIRTYVRMYVRYSRVTCCRSQATVTPCLGHTLFHTCTIGLHNHMQWLFAVTYVRTYVCIYIHAHAYTYIHVRTYISHMHEGDSQCWILLVGGSALC